MLDTVKLGIAAAALAVAFGAGWAVQGWRKDADIAELQRASAATTLAAVRAAEERADKLAQEQATIDTQRLKELQDAKDETQRLRTGVADGSIGLRIAATCPRASVQGTAPAASVGDDAGPRLTADAQFNYFSLRDGIATTQKQLAACQDILATQQH